MKKPTYVSLDSNLFIRALQDDPPLAQSTKPPHSGNRQWSPSETRKFLGVYLRQNKPTWVLHQAQLEELIRVTQKTYDSGMIRYLEKGQQKQRPATQQEQTNCREFLNYLKALQTHLSSGHEVPHVCYVPMSREGTEIFMLAERIRNDCTEFITVINQRKAHSNPRVDTIINLTAYHHAGKHPQAEHHIFTMDRDLIPIQEFLVHDMFPRVRGGSSRAPLPEPYQSFRTHICYTNPDDRRKTMPMLPLVHIHEVQGPNCQLPGPEHAPAEILKQEYPTPDF